MNNLADRRWGARLGTIIHIKRTCACVSTCVQTVQAGGGGYGCRLPARPRTPVFREAQKHVRRRLEKKWLAEFINTPEFKARNHGGSLQKDAHRGRRVSSYGQLQPFNVSKSAKFVMLDLTIGSLPEWTRI